MKSILFLFFLVTLVGCGSNTDHTKSLNERRYDSLVSIIRPEIGAMKKDLDYLTPTERDSALMLYTDLEKLSYPETKSKYELIDDQQELEFLQTLEITAQIVTLRLEMENKLKEIGH